jgi:hypothetical protein
MELSLSIPVHGTVQFHGSGGGAGGGEVGQADFDSIVI